MDSASTGWSGNSWEGDDGENNERNGGRGIRRPRNVGKDVGLLCHVGYHVPKHDP